jgi:1,4-dihydroxy-6-naphthoate synthase
MNFIKEISVAHSPDADDIFMYYAVKFGWVSSKKFKFQNIALDIETLNQKALKGEFDVSAISFALYPHIADDYALLRCAVSFGEGYGPKLIKKKDKILKRNFKVALSGELTTNALIFKLRYPEARIKYYNFLDIEKAILDGEVDAGVLIHESILDFDESLVVEAEIFDIWSDMAKDLPLPLGGMAIRRSLNLVDALDIEDTLIEAVRVADVNKNILSKMLIERDLIRVDSQKLEKYLSMYANSQSINLSDIQIKAIERLFELGYKAKFYTNRVDVLDSLLPREYRDVRFS